MRLCQKYCFPCASPGSPLFGIQHSNQNQLIIFGGSIPLQHEGRVIGAISVSGGTVQQDHQVAVAGASALETANV